jgi:hypothetical protein
MAAQYQKFSLFIFFRNLKRGGQKEGVKSGHLTYPQPVLDNVNYFLAIRKFSGARESDVKYPDLTLSPPTISEAM